MALGAIFGMIRKLNPYLVAGKLASADASLVLTALEEIDPALAIFDFGTKCLDAEDAELEALVRKRDEARERKDYEEADRIREELRRRRVILEDTPQGTLYWVEGTPGGSAEGEGREGSAPGR
jgi:cysteinyl-tRNA synthetase